MLPFASSDELDSIISSFQQSINFWYPTMSKRIINGLKSRVSSGRLTEESESCLAFLLMALGCASEATTSSFQGDDESNWRDGEFLRQRKMMGDMYFECAVRKIHVAYVEMSRAALHCLLFAG
jgi:hypothetical protein